MTYSVAVSRGHVTDRDLKYIREAVRRECGHQHKTEAAAEACRKRLQRVKGAGTNRTANSDWYDAIILRDGKSRE